MVSVFFLTKYYVKFTVMVIWLHFFPFKFIMNTLMNQSGD